MTSKSRLEQLYPEPLRSKCKISIETPTFSRACEILLVELGTLRGHHQCGLGGNELAARLIEAFEDNKGVPRPFDRRFAAVEAALQTAPLSDDRHIRVKEYICQLGWRFNPAPVNEAHGTATVWAVQDCKLDGNAIITLLRDVRMVIELERLRNLSFCCPLTGIALERPRDSKSPISEDVVEIDHCIPLNYADSPMRLTSRASNRIFGHLPWSVKGPVLSGTGNPPDVRDDLRSFLEFIRARYASLPEAQSEAGVGTQG